MNVDLFPGFKRAFVDVGTEDGKVCYRRGGTGPAVLLLHGFPETHLAWRKVAPRLADRFTVIAADLPGYGDSSLRDADQDHQPLSKRIMARQLVEGMVALGLSPFAVIGHDRGARVAYRMALDHPEQVTALAVLDIVPTLDVAQRLTYAAARQMLNWFLLAQPAELAERFVAANPDRYLKYILESWGGADVIEPEIFEEYARCFRNPRVTRTICSEYRAGDSVDLDHDRVDREEGRRIRCPVLVSWTPHGIVPLFGDPLSIWRQWADKVEGGVMNTRGHFIMEESPQMTAERIDTFLSTALTYSL